jgi:hypothetical protein
MADLNETAQWEAGIRRIETTDPVLGGEDGPMNVGIKQLANRTLHLRRQTTGVLDKSVAGNANVDLTVDEAEHGLVVLTGALTGNITVRVPATTGTRVIENRTTGAFDVMLGVVGGALINTLPQGERCILVSDGADIRTELTGLGIGRPGLVGIGGTGNVAGMAGFGSGTGAGVVGTGGDTDAHGVLGTGGGSGVGLRGVGGPTGGAGVSAVASANNASGVIGTGVGSGSGARGIGGASSGIGVRGDGGAPNGRGVHGTGQGTGAGVEGIGGASGYGVVGTGGGSSPGVLGTGGAGGAYGIVAQGTGGLAGLHAIGAVEASAGLRAATAGNAAGTIDGYRQGTFTPAIGTTGTNNVSHSTQEGKYARIGKLLIVTMRIVGNIGASTGQLFISGLPYITNTTVCLSGHAMSTTRTPINSGYSAHMMLQSQSAGGGLEMYCDHATAAPNSTIGTAFVASAAFTFMATAVFVTDQAF